MIQGYIYTRGCLLYLVKQSVYFCTLAHTYYNPYRTCMYNAYDTIRKTAVAAFATSGGGSTAVRDKNTPWVHDTPVQYDAYNQARVPHTIRVRYDAIRYTVRCDSYVARGSSSRSSPATGRKSDRPGF